MLLPGLLTEIIFACRHLNGPLYLLIRNNILKSKAIIFSLLKGSFSLWVFRQQTFYDGILSCYQRNVQWCLGYWTYATSTPFWLNRYWDFIDRIYFIEIELIEENKWKTFKRTFEKEIFHRSWHSHPSLIWLDVQFLMYNEGWNIMS